MQLQFRYANTCLLGVRLESRACSLHSLHLRGLVLTSASIVLLSTLSAATEY